MVRRMVQAVCLTAVVVLSATAAAQGDTSKQLLNEKARKAYQDGTRLFSEGKYVAAIDSFERAYQLKANYRVHCAVALCYHKLGKVVQAAERYKRCLAEGGDKSRLRRDIQASLREMEALITWVEVNSPGEGGTVYVDGTAAGSAPARVPVDPGTHTIEVRRDNADPARTTIKAVGGEEKVVTLVPEPKPVDLRVQKQPTEPEKPGSSRRRLPSYWFWAASGLTVALATVAVVLGAQTWGLREDYLDKPSESGYHSFTDRRLLTNIFAFSAVAAAGGSTLLFFYTDFGGKNKEQQDDDQIVLGVGLRGTF